MSSKDNVIPYDFASTWQRAMMRNSRGDVLDCMQNVAQIIERHPQLAGVLAFDDFSQTLVKLKPTPWSEAGEWTPRDDAELVMWCAAELQVVFKSQDQLVRGVLAAAQRHTFHPVRDWLDSLAWDKTERVDRWLTDCLGAKPGEYTALAGRHWLLNMVARIYEPGCIMRSVPVLEGAQERGKSTALKKLASPAWFSDSHLDVGNKDMYELIQGVWLYEIGEMAAFNKAEANRVKQMISSTEDSWVPKYIRGRIKVPRRMVFAGTTNEQHYLRDWTGNTRFVPIRCEAVQPINLEALDNMRTQLFAEAVALYRKDTRRYPTPEEAARLFAPEQDSRLLEHPWVGVVAGWIDAQTSKPSKITMREVMEDAIGIKPDKMTMLMAQDAGRVMAALGYERHRSGTGSRGWYYVLPKAPEGYPGTAAPQENEPDPF